jgi:hypothetical protein
MRLAGLAAAAALAVACSGDRPAMGEASTLIVVAADSLWAGVEADVLAALEPRIFTVRDESIFEVTHVSPASDDWQQLRFFRQILPIGRAADPWVAPALEEQAPPAALPGIVETQDVWARNQGVTAVVLPDSDGAQALRDVLPQLRELLDQRYRSYARSRMFVSRADTALRDTLRVQHGFSVLVPNVYRRTDLEQTQVFRNHAEMGGVLMRNFAVTWRAGSVAEPSTASVLAWRDSLSAVAYDNEQRTDTSRIETRVLEGGAGGLEVQGTWSSPDPTWPAAGPFITRLVPCPGQDRTYLLDAWLFAPGKRKYEYMIQLQTLLDSFACGDATGAGTAATGF